VGIPRTWGLLYSLWQPLEIPSAITPIGQLLLSLFLFVGKKPENPYFASHPGLEVKHVGVYPLG